MHFRDRPDADLMIDESDRDLLGLFCGESFGERGESPVPTPAQIYLFLDNLWEKAREDLDEFREEVRITYLHELGHYLGWDEDDMAAHGIE